MKAPEIKKFFLKHFGIPVAVRTVATKRRFCQIWIRPASKMHELLRYDHEFPATLGNQLLKIVYGEGVGGEGTTIAFPAGNIREHSLSLNEQEWEELKKLYPT